MPSKKYNTESERKEARRQLARAKYAENPEKFRAQQQILRDTNHPAYQRMKAHEQKKRDENPEFYRERSRQYYAADPEKHRMQRRKYVAANKEKVRAQDAQLRLKHRAIILERLHASRMQDPERFRDRERRWREKNREALRTREAQWRTEHKEAQIAIAARKRARKKGLPDTFTEADALFVREYWQYACAVCGREEGLFHRLEYDHWIPISSPACPGTIPGNMLLLCGVKRGASGHPCCNTSKRAKDPIIWLTEKLGPRQARAKIKEIETFFVAAKAFAESQQSAAD